MKTASVAGLCALSAMLAAAAGAYGSMAFDKRAGDLTGANLQMNEAATQLKVMSGLMIQLKQNDAATLRTIVEQSMRSAKATIEKGRSNPALTASTVVRLDEALSIAAVAEKPQQ
jgi:hypothetical protein